MAIVANGYRFEAHIVNGDAVVKCECGAIFDNLAEGLLVDIGEHVMQHLDEAAKDQQLEEPDDWESSMWEANH